MFYNITSISNIYFLPLSRPFELNSRAIEFNNHLSKVVMEKTVLKGANLHGGE